MAINMRQLEEMAAAYTAAWNSGNPAAVADHYAPGKGITINRGENQFGRDPGQDRPSILVHYILPMPTIASTVTDELPG